MINGKYLLMVGDGLMYPERADTAGKTNCTCDVPYVEAQERFAVYDASPVDGIAQWSRVGMSGGNRSRETSLDWMRPIESKKDLWPWLYLSDLLSLDPESGWDVSNSLRLVSKFKERWTEALRFAKSRKSLGFVLDQEIYVNYRAECERTSDAATKAGISKGEFIEWIRRVASELVDIADKIYPTATIWNLYAFIHNPQDEPLGRFASREFTLGMLERMKANRSRLTFVSGGEAEIGYTHESVTHCRSRVNDFIALYNIRGSQYPNLKLGAPIVLWHDWSLCDGWVRDWYTEYGHPNSFYTLADHYPKLAMLFEQFDYVWIYNEMNKTGYNPSDIGLAAQYNRVIRHAKYRSKIAAAKTDPRIYSVPCALASFDQNVKKSAFVRPEELM